MAITVERLKESLSILNSAELSEVQYSLSRLENLLPHDVGEALFLSKLREICDESIKEKQHH